MPTFLELPNLISSWKWYNRIDATSLVFLTSTSTRKVICWRILVNRFSNFRGYKLISGDEALIPLECAQIKLFTIKVSVDTLSNIKYCLKVYSGVRGVRQSEIWVVCGSLQCWLCCAMQCFHWNIRQNNAVYFTIFTPVIYANAAPSPVSAYRLLLNGP